MRVILLITVLAGLAGPALADHPAKTALTPAPGGKPCRTIWPPEPSCSGGPGYTVPGMPTGKLPFASPFRQVPLNPNHPGGPLVDYHPEHAGPYPGLGLGRVPGR